MAQFRLRGRHPVLSHPLPPIPGSACSCSLLGETLDANESLCRFSFSPSTNNRVQTFSKDDAAFKLLLWRSVNYKAFRNSWFSNVSIGFLKKKKRVKQNEFQMSTSCLLLTSTSVFVKHLRTLKCFPVTTEPFSVEPILFNMQCDWKL